MDTNPIYMSETARSGIATLARIASPLIRDLGLEQQICAWQALGELIPGDAGQTALATAKALRQADAAQLRFPDLLAGLDF